MVRRAPEVLGDDQLRTHRLRIVLFRSNVLFTMGPKQDKPVQFVFSIIFTGCLLLVLAIGLSVIRPSLHFAIVPAASFVVAAICSAIGAGVTDPGIVPAESRNSAAAKKKLNQEVVNSESTPKTSDSEDRSAAQNETSTSSEDESSTTKQVTAEQNSAGPNQQLVPSTKPASPDSAGQSENKAVQPEKFCKVCNIEQDVWTRHCFLCNVCVRELDHHCNVVGQCIGARNKVYFISMIANVKGGLWSIIILTVLLIVDVSQRESISDPIPQPLWVVAVIITIIESIWFGFQNLSYFMAFFGLTNKVPFIQRTMEQFHGRPNEWRPYTIASTALERNSKCCFNFLLVPRSEFPQTEFAHNEMIEQHKTNQVNVV